MESNVFENLLGSLEKRAAQNSPRVDDDYIGDDGLLYCGKCHTQKQTKLARWVGSNEEHIVCVPCKCQQEAEESRREAEKRERELDAIEKLRKNSLMDEKFLSSRFESSGDIPNNQRQLAIAKRYADKFGELYERNQGLLFWGVPGTGKTHVACCVGNKLMEEFRPVFATSFVKLLEKPFTKSELSDLIARMNVAQLLILDDLGAERDTDYSLEVVYNVVDSRYRAGKPMIITTNLSLSEMQNEPNIKLKRIYDRIFEVCYPVEFKGVSLRMKSAASRFDDMKKMLED